MQRALCLIKIIFSSLVGLRNDKGGEEKKGSTEADPPTGAREIPFSPLCHRHLDWCKRELLWRTQDIKSISRSDRALIHRHGWLTRATVTSNGTNWNNHQIEVIFLSLSLDDTKHRRNFAVLKIMRYWECSLVHPSSSEFNCEFGARVRAHTKDVCKHSGNRLHHRRSDTRWGQSMKLRILISSLVDVSLSLPTVTFTFNDTALNPTRNCSH